MATPRAQLGGHCRDIGGIAGMKGEVIEPDVLAMIGRRSIGLCEDKVAVAASPALPVLPALVVRVAKLAQKSAPETRGNGKV